MSNFFRPYTQSDSGLGRVFVKTIRMRGEKEMRKQLIDTSAIIRSIRSAFEITIDPSNSIRSIRKAISRYPSGRIYILHDNGYVTFYERIDGKKKRVKKDSDRIYQLARKRYLIELVETLIAARDTGVGTPRFEEKFGKLAELIKDFSKGNLDLARIAFTPKQYKWFAGNYIRKKITVGPEASPLRIPYGNIVRSKSEQVIGRELWNHAVPCHYEERLMINVRSIVESMISGLKKEGWSEKNLFYYRGGVCYWNVPKELHFINAPGSLWHTYDYKSGCVVIYPDFTIMLADGTLLYWEHEGLMDKIVYRINAVDRIFVMRSAGGINPPEIIETEERDSTNIEALGEIIKTRVIPGLWF